MSEANWRRFPEVGRLDQVLRLKAQEMDSIHNQFVNTMPGLTQEKLFAEMVESMYDLSPEQLHHLAWQALVIASGTPKDEPDKGLVVREVSGAFYIHPTD